MEQKIQKEKMKSDEEKKAAAEMVSQISLKLIFPKLLAKSKIPNPSPNKDMLLRQVYLGSHLSFSFSWLHLNIILLAFQVVAFKEISTPNCQNQQCVLQASCCTSQYHLIDRCQIFCRTNC
jgi:hypothetical protein